MTVLPSALVELAGATPVVVPTTEASGFRLSADDFERAIKSESSDKEYSKGMEMIYQRFYDSLKKLGLVPIVSTGQPFDPHIHHAVEMVETDEAPDHTVLEEYQKGYNFKGRLLRPAMVKVAVEPGSEK